MECYVILIVKMSTGKHFPQEQIAETLTHNVDPALQQSALHDRNLNSCGPSH
jgi:hypothetical protein